MRVGVPPALRHRSLTGTDAAFDLWLSRCAVLLHGGNIHRPAGVTRHDFLSLPQEGELFSSTCVYVAIRLRSMNNEVTPEAEHCPSSDRSEASRQAITGGDRPA